MDDHHFVSTTKGPKQNTGVEWECGDGGRGAGHDERERRCFFHEKVPGFHSEACEWPLGVAYGISSSLSGVQGINSCWGGAPDLVAPLFKLSSFPKLSFASLPCELCPSFPAPVIGGSFHLKRTLCWTWFLTLSKKLVDSLGACLSLVL